MVLISRGAHTADEAEAPAEVWLDPDWADCEAAELAELAELEADDVGVTVLNVNIVKVHPGSRGSRRSLGDGKVVALGENAPLVRNDVDAPLVARGEVRRGGVDVRVVGGLDVLGDGDGRVGLGRVDQLDGKVGRIGVDRLSRGR